MSKTVEKKQGNEQASLTKTASGALYMGVFFLAFSLLPQVKGEISIVVVFATLGALMFGLRGIYLSLIAMKFRPKPFSKNYWFSLFDDEFLNYLNMKGYKWAFTSIMFLLTVLFFWGGELSLALEDVSLQVLAMFQMGIMLLAYSFPIVYELRNEK